MARGEREHLAGEGTHTIRLIGELDLIDTRQYPLLRLIQEIALKGGNVREKWQFYLDGTFCP